MSQLGPLSIADPIARQLALLGRDAFLERRSSDALAYFHLALESARAALKAEPQNFVGMRDVAICWNQLASAHLQVGEKAQAYDAYDEAHDRYEALVKMEGEAGRSGGELARFLSRFAGLLMLDWSWDEAVLLLDRAREVSLLRLRVMPSCPTRLADAVEIAELLAVAKQRAEGS